MGIDAPKHNLSTAESTPGIYDTSFNEIRANANDHARFQPVRNRNVLSSLCCVTINLLLPREGTVGARSYRVSPVSSRFCLARSCSSWGCAVAPRVVKIRIITPHVMSEPFVIGAPELASSARSPRHAGSNLYAETASLAALRFLRPSQNSPSSTLPNK